MPLNEGDLQVVAEKAKAILGNNIVVVPEHRMVIVVAGGRYYCLDDDTDTFYTYYPYFVCQGREVRMVGIEMGREPIRTSNDIESAWAAAATNAAYAAANMVRS